MSDTSEALPQAHSSIDLRTVARLLAIALGIMSATLIAVAGFEVKTNQVFLEILEGVREFVGTIVWPFEKVLVIPIVNWLHSRGLAFDFHDHWKNVFVLLWLTIASVARAFSRSRFPVITTFRWVWGGLCALVAGGLTGTVPLSDTALFWWPLAGLTAFFGGFMIPRLSQSEQHATIIISLLMVTAFSLLGVGNIPILTADAPPFPSPGLAALAFLIGCVGAGFATTGLHRSSRIDIGSARAGLDILAVLGGAAFVVWLGNALA